MNINALKSVMVLYGDNQKDLASKVGLTAATVSRKFNRKYEWLDSEIKKIAEVYQLTPEQVFNIFIK